MPARVIATRRTSSASGPPSIRSPFFSARRPRPRRSGPERSRGYVASARRAGSGRTGSSARSCTQMLVTSEPTSMTASSPGVSSSMPAFGRSRGRTSANGMRSSPTGSAWRARPPRPPHSPSPSARQRGASGTSFGRPARTRRARRSRAPPRRRHRDELLDLEAERLAKLLLRKPRKRDLADDDALVPDAHHHLLVLEPAAPPQLAQRLADDLGLADLAVLDGPGQGHLGGPDERGGPPTAISTARTLVDPTSSPIRLRAITPPPPRRNARTGIDRPRIRGSGSSCRRVSLPAARS